ncbi:hypothetical protein RB595_005564 [Gaeumannomyces hyphopodioides]
MRGIRLLGNVNSITPTFEKAGHSYSRLEPWNKNDRALQADGEGSLSKGKPMKRSENHFALWKASKPGEPAWPSPWGRERPGWHIECSAMASEAIGKTIDIHSGGVDLCFPHYDNELAQSEAYWSTPGCPVQWTNYFVHMGQLRIRGLKMSKSLKNYTTIRTALSQNEWSARSLRICFLLMPWQDGIEVTDELMKAVVGWEGKLNNFFLKSLDIWKHSRPEATGGPFRPDRHLARPVGDTHWWSGLDIPAPAKPYVYPASQLRDKIRTLACSGSVDYAAIAKLADGTTNAASTPVIESSQPYNEVLQQFRTDVKAIAARQASAKDLLALCDQLRDVHLWNLGIYLEDRSSPHPALIRPLDKLLVEARAEQESAGAAKARAKLEQKAREAEAEKKLRERAKVDPLLMFKTSDEYLEWDESGIPTVDAAGNVVSKSRRKKLIKEWEKQKMRYEEWLATQPAA